MGASTRNTKNFPFCWQEKPILRLIKRKTENSLAKRKKMMLTYLALSWMESDFNGGGKWYIKTIMSYSGLSRNRVYEALKSLEKLKIIKRTNSIINGRLKDIQFTPKEAITLNPPPKKEDKEYIPKTGIDKSKKKHQKNNTTYPQNGDITYPQNGDITYPQNGDTIRRTFNKKKNNKKKELLRSSADHGSARLKNKSNKKKVSNKVVVSNKKEKRTPEQIKESKNIIAIFDVLKEKNKHLNNSFNNNTYRDAIKNMINDYGFKKTKEMAEYAMKVFGKSYYPTVTTPHQLYVKFAQLEAIRDRDERGEGNQRGVKIEEG